MENFKLENFRREYPNIEFPKFSTLDDKEIFSLQCKLFRKLRLTDKDLLKLTKIIDSMTSIVGHTDVNNDNFDLLTLLSNKNIRPNELVYLNWYRYDQIDKMKLTDLDKYFYDIWYPISDDIDIFDDSCSWVLSVRHYGILSLAKLPP